jgi:serine/threonine protein kinase
MLLQGGCRVGRYEIDRFLGGGTAGEVYRARDTQLGRAVALKVLRAGGCVVADRFTRLTKDARTTALINHPNIVAVYDVGAADGVPFVASELLEGETLRSRLRGGPLPVPLAVRYALQIAHGLIAAHHLGVVHGALKPENLIVGENGELKIVDFGLAGWRGDATEAGRMAGYLSPEHISGEVIDERSDIFGLGVVLYEMLAGASPFDSGTTIDTLLAVQQAAPRPLPARIGLTPDLAHTIEHCLEKRPAARFQSGRDVAFVLEFMLRAPRPVAPVGAPARRLPAMLRRLWPAVC